MWDRKLSLGTIEFDDVVLFWMEEQHGRALMCKCVYTQCLIRRLAFLPGPRCIYARSFHCVRQIQSPCEETPCRAAAPSHEPDCPGGPLDGGCGKL